MTTDEKVIIDSRDLARLCTKIFHVYGVPQREAEQVSAALVEANLRGHDSHGVIRAPKWIQGITAGGINPRCAPKILRESPAMALLDGDRGLGCIVAHVAVDHALEKAKRVGVAVVSVRRASHIGMLQLYAERMALEWMIGIVMTNTEPGMAPYGGVDKVLGLNPICIGIPTQSLPMVLDMSTSIVARGKIVVAQSRGEPIPEGWAIDAGGEATTDPAEALRGALLPVGGYKGSGLSMMIDVLTGALSGAGVGRAVQGTFDMTKEPTKGDTFVAIHPEMFVSREQFLSSVERLKTDVKSGRVAKGFDQILLPGELELQTRTLRIREGIPLDRKLFTQLTGLAKR